MKIDEAVEQRAVQLSEEFSHRPDCGCEAWQVELMIKKASPTSYWIQVGCDGCDSVRSVLMLLPPDEGSET